MENPFVYRRPRKWRLLAGNDTAKSVIELIDSQNIRFFRVTQEGLQVILKSNLSPFLCILQQKINLAESWPCEILYFLTGMTDESSSTRATGFAHNGDSCCYSVPVYDYLATPMG